MKRINWTAALSKPVEEITLDESGKLLYSAKDWRLCACGTHCKKLPRGIAGEPRDRMLFALGADFALYVEDLCFSLASGRYRLAAFAQKQALTIHNKIERRAAKLLAKMEASPNIKPEKL